jgi:uracil-DNA glycosylase family 4
LALHNAGEGENIIKRICEDYIPADEDIIKKRMNRLKKNRYFFKNRPPSTQEIKVCTAYLDEQIRIIKPKIICPLGRFATSFIFEKYGLKPVKISKAHGRIFKVNTIFGLIKIIPLFHPAVATYDINKKKVLIDDFKSLKQFV